MADRFEARRRGAETQRRRSREALIAAATNLFTERGWLGTRLDDVAKTANVSPATAFNHFRTKQTLIGYVYQPLFEPLMSLAEQGLADEKQTLHIVLVEFINEFTKTVRSNYTLTVSLLAAIHEQRSRSAEVTDPEDVRNLVPLSRPLALIIGTGQQRGEYQREPEALDIANYHTGALLDRVESLPHEAAEDTAGIVLSQLTPSLALRTEPVTIQELARKYGIKY